MLDRDKIVIWDWGGIVESHFQGKNNWDMAKINIINYLTAETKQLEAQTILNKWEECKYGQDGKCVSEVNSEEEMQNWFERLAEKFNLQCDYNKFCQVYREEGEKIKYYRNVVEFAHSLKGKCKIGILSNLIKLDKERIDKQYDLSKFDFVWLSFELSCRKPDEKIYEIVEEQVKIPTKNILFIDDKAKNIETARKRGWKVCLATALEFEKIKICVNEFLEDRRE